MKVSPSFDHTVTTSTSIRDSFIRDSLIRESFIRYHDRA